MKHITKKIWENTSQLTELDIKHLEECDICKKEYELAKKIESSIEELPEINIPLELEKIIAKVLLKPYYKIWQLILIGLWVVLSPLFLQLDVFSIMLKNDQIYMITILFVLIYMLVIVVFGFHFYLEYEKQIEVYSKKIDIFLENKLMKIQK